MGVRVRIAVDIAVDMAVVVAVVVRSLVGLEVAHPSETLTGEVLSFAGLARCYHLEHRWRSGWNIEFQFERCGLGGPCDEVLVHFLGAAGQRDGHRPWSARGGGDLAADDSNGSLVSSRRECEGRSLILRPPPGVHFFLL